MIKTSYVSNELKRVYYAPNGVDIYKSVCFTETKKFAAFEAEDRFLAMGKDICRLIATEGSYFGTWIASGVQHGFLHKRTFNIGYSITFLRNNAELINLLSAA